ncbi:putative bifunctional diguanylate cyclase/phosphodiesterase [Gemmobacter denitrificans]|uniref:Bifunctional diguanylate cyclase/phosphodiesterase n=1 Tax=Gemmobacter denitrificans TaxID=3123040 RepID=A0ABU8BW60_9RHOB
MQRRLGQRGWDKIRFGLGVLRRPEFLIFLPALTLAAFWIGGERALLVVALIAPLIFLLGSAIRPEDTAPPAPETLDGLGLRPQMVQTLDRVLQEAPVTGRNTACIVLMFDDADSLLDRHGRAAQGEVLARSAERLSAALRQGDMLVRLEGGGFAIALAPQRRLELETLVQLSARLQSAVAPPISVNGIRIYVSCSVGFCLGAQLATPSGKALLDAAQVAAAEALRNGPGAIRGYAHDMPRRRADRDALRATLETALDEGQIRPWFQPQVSTDSGTITGFEALARWHHPERGVVPPAEFLSAIEEAGLIERLGEVMLYHALAALVRWDKAGLHIPRIGVNFSGPELRNPRLVERLQWELERFDLSPDRLAVEVLETVVATTENDIIVQNIDALARLGCCIDLDDFGTGHAAIGNIRRFAVTRLKIDRSFVKKVDEDRDQQKMVAAILSLAEQLGLETLAEGVETPGEHAMLAQLGCGHVQGFGIGRPMPFDQTMDWITSFRARQPNPPRIGSRAG